MNSLFYDHLIGFEEVVSVINEHKLSPKKRQELLELIDNTMHHHILDEILTHLPYEKHKTFLDHLTRDPHDPGILLFLKQEIVVIDIEKAIKKRAKGVKKELLAEIKKAKK